MKRVIMIALLVPCLALTMTLTMTLTMAAPTQAQDQKPAKKPTKKTTKKPSKKTGKKTTKKKATVQSAKEVKSTLEKQPYHYVVTTREEKKGDQKVKNSPECDIKAVLAYNDAKLLCVKIVLHSSVNFKTKIAYMFRIKYAGEVIETYGYNPNSKRLFYLKTKDGKTIKRSYLKASKGSDFCRLGHTYVKDKVTVKNNVVALYIDKDKHFSKKDYGKYKTLTAECASAFVTKDEGIRKIADETKWFKLRYKR